MKYIYKDVHSQTELIDLLLSWIQKDGNENKPMKEILQDIGFFDTVNLFDSRTSALLEEYLYYSSPATPPAPHDNELWKLAVIQYRNLIHG